MRASKLGTRLETGSQTRSRNTIHAESRETRARRDDPLDDNKNPECDASLTSGEGMKAITA